MACDGIWDVLSDQEVVDIVTQHLGNAKEAAKAIVREVMCSCMVMDDGFGDGVFVKRFSFF